MSAQAFPLCETVQRNCHIADARHAGDYTLCVYLLKMREYFRWEMGFPYSASLPKEAVGEWLKTREALWGSLEDAQFDRLSIDGRTFDPFDTESINEALLPRGYVYSAGLGIKAAPHFFLGRLDRSEQFAQHTILVADEECARDLAAPPAMALNGTIFIRRESLRRMLWEKVQEWRWHRQENAMAKALSFYPFDIDLDEALERMTEHELQVLRNHEIGEVMARRSLGPQWSEMLASLPRSRAELMARAVRDHLADALSTLPSLLDRDDEPSLHFYMANMGALRRELFPSFETAYRCWAEDADRYALDALVERSAEHWSKVAERALALYRGEPEQLGCRLERLISESAL